MALCGRLIRWIKAGTVVTGQIEGVSADVKRAIKREREREKTIAKRGYGPVEARVLSAARTNEGGKQRNEEGGRKRALRKRERERGKTGRMHGFLSRGDKSTGALCRATVPPSDIGATVSGRGQHAKGGIFLARFSCILPLS